MKKKHTFALVTHGCKVNQYESQSLREAWITRGFVEVENLAQAATVCVSTCAVTAKAVAEARAVVRKAHRENPEARILVTGCAVQVAGKTFWDLPGVVLVVSQQQKVSLLRPAENFFSAGRIVDNRDDGAKKSYPPFTVMGYDRSRAVVKVQDGCSHHCSYCIVPFTRGAARSRQPQESVAEARRLLEAGFREIVVNGINLAQYGRDFSTPHDFWDLVLLLEKELAPRWAGRARIRLSSLEPGQLGQKALDVLGSSLLVAPHLHLSLQSGSIDVLRRMGRGHYDPDTLHDFFRCLKPALPRFGLGADILSGFPGETDDDASQTEALCEALPFSYAHVFPYSRRPGTAASSWKDQVDAEVKKERASRLRTLFAQKKHVFLAGSLNLPEVRIACEAAVDEKGKVLGGVNEFYAECRFMPGTAPDTAAHRSLITAKPIGVVEGCLLVVAQA